MAIRPDRLPLWATDIVTETRQVEGTLQELVNREEPTEEFKATGLLYRQNLARQWLNYQFYILNSWVEHLDERYSVGDIHLTTSSETAAEISERLGGSWVNRGSQAIGNVVAQVWEKVS